MLQERQQRAAALSVIVTVSLSAMELSVGFWSGAVSVVANGVQSAIDLMAALTAWFAIRQSAKPPDADHRYGHGKFESLLGAVQALLIWAACGFIVAEAIRKLLKGAGVAYPLAGIAVMAVSVIVGFAVSQHLFMVARQTDSLALEADAWHLRADALAALMVLIGLAVLSGTDWHFLDPLLALAVVTLIVKAGFDLLRQATTHLLDTALPPDEEAAIEGVLCAHAPQFINVHRLRTRRAGAKRYIDLHLVVRDDMTVDEAHRLCDAIETGIHKALSDADVTIHVESESAFKSQGEEDKALGQPIIRRETKHR